MLRRLARLSFARRASLFQASAGASRRRPSFGVAAAALALAWATPQLASAQASLSSAAHDPLEQRIAVALGPSRTVVWTQIHATTEAGGFALIVPVAPGAALDLSTEAWLEALEASTAPRVLPPSGVEARCPGDEGPPPFHVAGDLDHHPPLVPLEIETLPGAAEVLLWAAERGLEVPSAVAQAFAQSTATHFVALRFTAPAGELWTPTLRVVFPGVATTLPRALTRAGSVELRATLFVFAEGRAALPGASVAIDGASLVLDASSRTSNYLEARSAALAGPGSWLVESASHTSLVSPLSLGGGETIPALTAEYFRRASTYGAATSDPSACALASNAAIASSGVFSEACPRSDLGLVDGGPACVEEVGPGETDAGALRCGGDADDLALALSGLAGPDAWLTRIALRTAPEAVAEDVEVSALAGPVVSPVIDAGEVDLSQCGEGGGGGGSGEGGQNGAGPVGSGPSGPSGTTGVASGGGAGSPTYVEVPVQVYDVTCGCVGEYVIVDYVEVPEDQAPEDGSYYAEDGDDCGGESSESYDPDAVESEPTGEDECGGDSSGSSESDGGCGSDTSETSDTSTDGGGCGSDTTSDDGGSDDGGDDGGSDDGGDGDGDGDDGGSGDDSGCDCGDEKVAAAAATFRAQPKARRTLRARPKLSVMALGLAFVVAPLRRLTRPRRASPRTPPRPPPR